MNLVQRKSSLVVLALLAGVAALGQAKDAAWVGTWAAPQQTPEPQNALAIDDMRDMTMRQIVHLSLGGRTLRVHISNAFGTEPLRFTSVHIARPLSPSGPQIDSGSDRALAFSGSQDVIVPAGAEYISDPIDYPAQWADVPDTARVDHWYQLSGVDVRVRGDASALAILGDSITDGHCATTNGNDRWTDVLAARLEASPATRRIGVLNQGIGGNHLLTDGLGQNALARFDRDVLVQTGVRYVIVFEGVNDLGGLTRLGEASPAAHAALVDRILSAYEQMIVPFAGSDYYHPPASTEADRQAVNQWIRTPGHFDGVIDFDKVVRDSEQPDRLLPAYDCGDHLHPNPTGYRAMGNAVPLSLFRTK